MIILTIAIIAVITTPGIFTTKGIKTMINIA